MEVLTILVLLVAVVSAAIVNGEIQRRLLARGGRWLPSTVLSGLCGTVAMVGIVATYFGAGSMIIKMMS